MRGMFFGCKRIKELDLSSFDTSILGKMDEMFRGCEQLETIYASNKFVVDNATGNYVFSGTENLAGGSGTNYNDYGDARKYARLDDGMLNPGYFTDKTPKITITFNPNGGSVNMESKLLTVGSKIKSMPIPFKNGYKFTGWYTDPEDGEKITYDFEPQEDLIIYAHWEESSDTTNVFSYIDMNNDGIISQGDSITINTDEFWVLSTSNDGNINLMAKYNLDSNYRQNDSSYESVSYSETEYWINAYAATSSPTSDEPTDEEKTDLHPNFIKDENGYAYIYRTKKNKDTDNNLYSYINNYKSHLENDMGINGIIDVKLIPIEEVDNSSAEFIDMITNQDYWFGSVHHGEYNGSYDNTLYSACSEYNRIERTSYSGNYGIRPYVTISSSLIDHEAIVKLDSQGGDKYNSIIYLYTDESTTIENLPTPTKFDSVFDGWYTDNTYTTRVTEDTIVSNSVTYYAKWISCNGFASDSWETINENILNNESYYPIGCRKEIETTDNYLSYQNSYDGVNKLYVRIINNTTPSECSRTDFSQTACGVVLDFENIIMRGNTSSLYSDSGDIADKLEFTDQIIPDELKNIIIDTKVISEYNQNLNETNSKYYNLAISEIYGNGTIYENHNNYTRQLDYYSKENTSLENYSSAKKKVVFLDSGSPKIDNIWVLRNKKEYDWTYYYVGVGGYPYVYNERVGISPAFRIGKSN